MIHDCTVTLLLLRTHAVPVCLINVHTSVVPKPLKAQPTWTLSTIRKGAENEALHSGWISLGCLHDIFRIRLAFPAGVHPPRCRTGQGVVRDTKS